MDNGGAAFFFFFVILIIIWIFALSGSVRERRARVILGYQPVVENYDNDDDNDDDDVFDSTPAHAPAPATGFYSVI